MDKLRPKFGRRCQSFRKRTAQLHFSYIDIILRSINSNVLHQSIASILLALPIHATTPEDISKSNLSIAISLLDSVVDCIDSGPTILDYREQVSDNVKEIKKSLTATQTEVTEIASFRDLYANICISGFLEWTDFSSFIYSITTFPLDSTMLVLINKTYLSAAQEANLGNYTRAIIVGNYTPTGLTYSSLINLQSLRMFDGEMTDDVRDAISDLAKSEMKLKYLEIPKWGTSIKASAFELLPEYRDLSIQKLVGFEDVTSTGNKAFRRCSGLLSVSFPNLTLLNGEMFSGCGGLTSVYLPKLVTAKEYEFFGCSSLTSLELPELTTAGDNAFRGCSSLNMLYCPKLARKKAASTAFLGVPPEAIHLMD
jgi:hypothetical protein